MSDLTVELFDHEIEQLRAAHVQFKSAKGRNFDGIDVNITVLVASSAVAIKAICGVLTEIIKKRRSSAIKINGVDVRDISEGLIQELIRRHDRKQRRPAKRVSSRHR